jgi:membrane protein DedA with SNARE-associated domain/rhodanese-related sulfurtransferase
MTGLQELFERFGLGIVFVNALLHELGVPLPLTPTVMLAGASPASDVLQPLGLVLAVVVGTLIGNSVWFAAGRRYGGRVLAALCRVSLSPDTCVGKTERTFGRWGASSLVVGRFIPGVSLVAPPIAGAVGMSWHRFLGLSSAGAALWAVVIVALGSLLQEQLNGVIAAVEGRGEEGAAALVAVVAAYVAWRWVQRRRARRMDAVERVTVEELRAALRTGRPPVVFDVRGPTMQRVERRRIPGAHAVDLDALRRVAVAEWADREIVLYCACPNEASAAAGALILHRRGHTRARALRGGLEGWIAAGHDTAAD